MRQQTNDWPPINGAALGAAPFETSASPSRTFVRTCDAGNTAQMSNKLVDSDLE